MLEVSTASAPNFHLYSFIRIHNSARLAVLEQMFL